MIQSMPSPGLTFRSNGLFDVSDVSILVGVDDHRYVNVLPLEAFVGNAITHDVIVVGQQLNFDDNERKKIANALSESNIYVTIPEPQFLSHDWLEDLAQPGLKPGHVWLNSEQTLSDLLKTGITSRRRDTPSHPISPAYSDDTAARRPIVRPEPGLTQVIDQNCVLCDGAADRLRVNTATGHELHVQLIDCYVADQNAQEVIDLVRSAHTVAITMPPPIDSVDWIGTLVPNSEHAAYVWISHDRTLNAELVSRGLATTHA